MEPILMIERNLVRNRRRTNLTGLAMAVATFSFSALAGLPEAQT
jgi:hypothetical protein